MREAILNIFQMTVYQADSKSRDISALFGPEELRVAHYTSQASPHREKTEYIGYGQAKLTSDKRYLVAVDYNYPRFHCWDTQDGSMRGPVEFVNAHVVVFLHLTKTPSSHVIFAIRSKSGFSNKQGYIEVWDMSRFELVQRLSEPIGVFGLATNSSDTALLSGYITDQDTSGEIHVWRRASLSSPFESALSITAPAFRVEWSPDETNIVSMDRKRIMIWDGVSGQQLKVFECSVEGCSGNMILTARLSAFVLVPPNFRSLRKDKSPLVIGVDGEYYKGEARDCVLVGGSGGGSVWIYDLKEGKLVSVLPGNASNILSFYYSSSKNCLLANSGVNVYIWRIATAELIKTSPRGHSGCFSV